MSSELLELRVDEHDGATVVTCAGELDVFTREAFDALVRPLTGAAGVLVLDMRRVTFVDSSGLCSLLMAMRAYDDRAHALRIVPSSVIRDLFRVTGIPLARLDDDPPPGADAGSLPSYPPSHWRAVLARARERMAETDAAELQRPAG